MDDRVELGAVLKDYRLDSVIGAGGMGCVYSATHQRLGRRVAIKVLSHELTDSQQYVSRFLHEAKIVNDAHHPNIVDITDFLEMDEPRLVAYVMEFIDGPSLEAVLKDRVLSFLQASNVVVQVADALNAVHRLGVVHRDLKPENLHLLDRMDGDFSVVPSVKVLDFGIAKTSDPNAGHRTETGVILGTPKYMAPEQIAADPVSPATDVYAVGEMLFEMVSGLRVFRGLTSVATLKAKITGEIPPLDLPNHIARKEEVQQLVRDCLLLDPQQRPSLNELCDRLLEIREYQSSEVTQRGALPPLVKSEYVDSRTPAAMSSVAMTAKLAAPPKKYWLELAVGMMAAVIVGVGLWIGFSNRELRVAPLVLPAEIPAPEPVIKEPAVEVTPLLPDKHEVEVDSVPSGARILDAVSGEELGRAPQHLEVPPKSTRKVRLELDGFESTTVELSGQRESLAVALVKKRRMKRSRPKKKVEKTESRESTVIKKRKLKEW